ncbi:MAG TPA: hypothetical protein VG407_09640 [Caulobacteraceae bacterium]|jgi:hypothetical protein|nr:hypothetical protein [Caulobacteraceae bacterium]
MLPVILAVAVALLKPGAEHAQAADLPTDRFHTTVTTEKCKTSFEETRDGGVTRRFTIDWAHVTSVAASRGDECREGRDCQVSTAPTVVIWGTPGALKGVPFARLTDAPSAGSNGPAPKLDTPDLEFIPTRTNASADATARDLTEIWQRCVKAGR